MTKKVVLNIYSSEIPLILALGVYHDFKGLNKLEMGKKRSLRERCEKRLVK